jgi:hypothetical protein
LQSTFHASARTALNFSLMMAAPGNCHSTIADKERSNCQQKQSGRPSAGGRYCPEARAGRLASEAAKLPVTGRGRPYVGALPPDRAHCVNKICWIVNNHSAMDRRAASPFRHPDAAG